MKKLIVILFTLMTTFQAHAQACTDSLMVRIAEIEVYPEHLHAYLEAAAEVGSTSVHEEPGVVCIFPMQMRDDSTQIRIIEIYRSPEAYESHLHTAHFLRYKTGTLHMVKSLRLPAMQPLDPKAMPAIFAKMAADA